MVVLPDYNGGSIVNIVASIQRSFRSRPRVPTVRWLDPELKGSKNIVLLLVDGLGAEYMGKNGRGSLLDENYAGTVTSMFPSTTAACITSLATGVPPSQHGIISWFMWAKEFGMVIKPLHFSPRLGGVPLDEMVDLERKEWFPRKTVFNDIRPKPYMITRKEYIGGYYDTKTTAGSRKIGYTSLKGIIGNIEKVICKGNGRKFVHAYWPQFDGLCHEYGTRSPKVKKHYHELDAAIRKLYNKLAGTNTTIVVTADHGLLDIPFENNFHLEDLPKLGSCLTMPLTGEGRAPFCYVRPDRVGEFKRRVKKDLRGKFELHKSWDLVERGYFGPGPYHPRLYERVGDFTLLAKGDYALNDQLLGESREVFKARHGGLSSTEMLVPVCTINC